MVVQPLTLIFDTNLLLNYPNVTTTNINCSQTYVLELVLSKEIFSLERALYNLSEQSVNVPKIFSETRKGAKTENLQIYPSSEKGTDFAVNVNIYNASDDDVIVIEDSDDNNQTPMTDQIRIQKEPNIQIIEML